MTAYYCVGNKAFREEDLRDIQLVRDIANFVESFDPDKPADLEPHDTKIMGKSLLTSVLTTAGDLVEWTPIEIGKQMWA